MVERWCSHSSGKKRWRRTGRWTRGNGFWVLRHCPALLPRIGVPPRPSKQNAKQNGREALVEDRETDEEKQRAIGGFGGGV